VNWGVCAGIALMAAMAAATVRVAWLQLREAGAAGGVTVRICHWQLEGGVREAFDAIARAYEARHPGVRVVQMPVPGRVYATWLKTRQVGGDLPDLVQLGAADDETLASHFTPLTAWVEQPNPYQVGTPLEGRPWREGFLDGLAGANGMATLQEPYSVAYSAHTTRLYVNRDLYRRITGCDAPPADLAALVAVCGQAEAWARRTGVHLTPIAGSRFTANVLLEQLFRSQTQRRGLELDELRVLRAPGRPGDLLLDGRLTADEPAVRSGFAAMREAARFMQTGFLGYDRDEAIFHFVTGRALFIATGSWDYGSIVSQAPFAVSVLPTPLPSPGDPRFGAGVLGATAESADRISGNLHLSARCRHPEVAVDVLRFLTSTEGNRLFVAASRWMPGIVGVEPHPDTVAFRPVQEGYPAGFAFAPLMWGAGEVYRVQSQHLHLLFSGADDGLDRFLAAFTADLPAAAARDLAKDVAARRGAVRRLDPALVALGVLGDPIAQRRAAGLWQTQNQREWELARSAALSAAVEAGR
jgi:raffinose/stachyose/melibiose transport system substrate-binding protein